MDDKTSFVDEPVLSRRTADPQGVVRKNLKMMVYLGAALVLIVASILSSRSTKASSKTDLNGKPPQPFVQDNTAANVQDMKAQVASEAQKQQDAATAASLAATQFGTPAQQASAAMYGPTGQPQAVNCVPGQTCPPSA